MTAEIAATSPKTAPLPLPAPMPQERPANAPRSAQDEPEGRTEGTAATPAEKPSKEELLKAMFAMNAVAAIVNRSVSFSVDSETGTVQIRVTDTDNREIIRTIPSDEMLAIFRRIHEFVGLLIDEKR
jgi:flagellar protein FlaG